MYEGPYYVKERVGRDTYILKHPTTEIRGMFHLSNLKPYHMCILHLLANCLPGKVSFK